MNQVWILGRLVGSIKIEVVRTRRGPVKKARMLVKTKKNGRYDVLPLIAWDRVAEKLEQAGLKPGTLISLNACLHAGEAGDDTGAQVALVQVFISDFSVVDESA